jgi:hypothetical protein
MKKKSFFCEYEKIHFNNDWLLHHKTLSRRITPIALCRLLLVAVGIAPLPSWSRLACNRS